MTPQQKHQYWQAQLQAQADSGLSKAAFCQRQGIRPSTFYYWATKLKAPETSRHHSIHPVVVSEPGPHNQAHHLILSLPNGCQLTFPPALEPDTLQFTELPQRPPAQICPICCHGTSSWMPSRHRLTG